MAPKKTPHKFPAESNPENADESEIVSPAGPQRFTPVTPGGQMRDYLDELVFIFVIVMFMKLFICELYKIPSGSMTPTLLGSRSVLHVDVDNDGRKDIVNLDDYGDGHFPHVYLRQENGRYVYTENDDPRVNINETRLSTWTARGISKPQFDRILVNKQAYWFKNPSRGDIVVFKVPDPPYRPEAPIYIKRLVGEPGDTLSFTSEGQLIANGKRVEKPDFFTTQHYLPNVDERAFEPRDGVEKRPVPGHPNKINLLSVTVPEDEAYVFGDNAHASLDSRYWGGVPLNHFKGRAFMRVWPIFQFTHLK